MLITGSQSRVEEPTVLIAQDAVAGTESDETLLAQVKQLGCQRVFVITTSGREDLANTVRDHLAANAALTVSVFTKSIQHVPVGTVDAAWEQFSSLDADTVLAVGGGTPIGLAKAVAQRASEKGKPCHRVYIPTTYSGSEVTNIWAVTADGAKTTARSEDVRANLVVYDPVLFETLPSSIAVPSLINAAAHCAEVLYSPEAGPILIASATSGLDLILKAVRAYGAGRVDTDSLIDALTGSYLAGLALSCPMGLHHKICHVLGGSYHTPHSQTHTVILPHVLAFNLVRDTPPFEAMSKALGNTDDPAGALFDIIRDAGGHTCLRKLDGSLVGELDTIAERVCESSYSQARFGSEVTKTVVWQIVHDAFTGRRPSHTPHRHRQHIDNSDFPGLHERVPTLHVGPPLADGGEANPDAVVICVHGRFATDERIVAMFEKAARFSFKSHTDTLAIAPLALGHQWYNNSFLKSREENEPKLSNGLAVIDAIYKRVRNAGIPPTRIFLFGFSQGACMLLEWAATSLKEQIGGIAAISGGLIGPELASEYGGALHRTPVLLGASHEDAHVPRDRVTATASVIRSLGGDVTDTSYPGDAHSITAEQSQIVHDMFQNVLLDRASSGGDYSYHTGFGNYISSEVIPGTIPQDMYTPKNAPYGLYPECLNGTAFTAHRDENKKVWMYRIRPSVMTSAYKVNHHPSLKNIFDSSSPVSKPADLARWKPLPIPDEGSEGKVDFVDGLRTFGGLGDPNSRNGYAIHLYACNSSMNDRCFFTNDGHFLIVPQEGTLDILTEMGRILVSPSECVVIPRGLKFTVQLTSSAARGFACEVYNAPWSLPSRGPIGSNHMADERHFQIPTAWYEDRDGLDEYRVTAKLNGVVHEATQHHSPYDVVGWAGNYVPYKYNLMMFSPVGAVLRDHIDPSAHTVLTVPFDKSEGSSLLDFVVFRGRWDASEGTFRPPYFHRNAATEFNAIIDVESESAGFMKGGYFLTPLLLPHGVNANTVGRILDAPAEPFNKPVRLSDNSLWIMFESTLSCHLTEWAATSPNRDTEFRNLFQGFQKRFTPPTSQ